MSILPPYNKKRKCSKCGDKDISTRLCHGGHYGVSRGFCAEGEHLHRHCRNCSFEWLEAILSRG